MSKTLTGLYACRVRTYVCAMHVDIVYHLVVTLLLWSSCTRSGRGQAVPEDMVVSIYRGRQGRLGQNTLSTFPIAPSHHAPSNRKTPQKTLVQKHTIALPFRSPGYPIKQNTNTKRACGVSTDQQRERDLERKIHNDDRR
jgi:hypothetical protein